MADIPFSIAPLERIEDFLACERLQQAVWRLEAEQMPKATATMLIASQRYGGIVLGAFDVINPGRARADGWTEPGPLRSPEGAAVLVEILAHIQAIKRAGPGLALAWRLNVREACEAAFAAGYTACDVVKATVEGIPRAYYLCAADQSVFENCSQQ